MTTAADIKAALLKHYAPPGWRVFFEVANDTGASARRWIDAVALGIWPSTGHEIIGIEIKVSRGDFHRELADPAKAQELMRYCTRWCLACPAGLVADAEVPANWGVLTLQSNGTIKRKKAPPLLKPEPLAAGFMMAVLRQHESPDMDLVNRLVAEQTKSLTDQIDQRIARAAEERVRDVSRKSEHALKIGQRIKQLTGVEIDDWQFDPEAIAAAYLFFKHSHLHQNRDDWSAFDNLAGALRRASETLAKVTAEPAFSFIKGEIDDAKSRGGEA